MNIGRTVIPAGIATGSATELYLAAILAELCRLNELLGPAQQLTDGDDIALHEPALKPKHARAKR